MSTRAASWRGGSAVRPKRWRLPLLSSWKLRSLQFQRRRAAQFVEPGDAGIADHDALLHQQPVGEAFLVARAAG
jgi:hypothetical protein